MSKLLEYKCPCCGGAITFDSTSQKMKCPFCDTEFEPETLFSYDEELKNDKEDDMNWDDIGGNDWEEGETAGMRVYVCNSCGGEVVADENTSAASCPYCGNPVVMKGNLSGTLKPDYIIPFKLDKEAAKAALKNHLNGKKLLPKVFTSENHIDEIKGIYVPFWLFDADADAQIRYKATKTRVWSDRKYDYTETSYYSVFRSGTLAFDKVPVDGASMIDDDLMESIEPFDFSEAVDFQTAYLAGYLANKYDVDAEQSIERANARIKASTEQAFAETVNGYATVVPESSSVKFNNGQTHYALYPVWLLNTTWNGKKYTFAMNGQTGKFVGDLPVDRKKYWAWFALVGLGVAAAVLGISYLLWMI